MEHNLKTWPLYFRAVLDGTKTFEIRNCTDRTFTVGDILVLQEWDPDDLQGDGYTGRILKREVTYLVQGPPWLPHGLAVMSLAPSLG